MLASLNIEEIFEHACTLDNNYDVNATFLHFFNNDACDSLYRQIFAVKKIDKKRITPNWFIKQTVAKQIHIYLGECLQDVEQVIDLYMLAGQTLNEKKLTYCAAVFLAHCFEVISYCEQIVESVNVKLPILEQNHMEKSCVWDYAVNFRNYLQPFLHLHTLKANLLFYRELGIKGVLE